MKGECEWIIKIHTPRQHEYDQRSNFGNEKIREGGDLKKKLKLVSFNGIKQLNTEESNV